ncbi:hypothetical protein [Azospirillum sp. B2RO_4]|uniref:hypothetical protein n=1 Tax=Azospirillum sp. B2RO_4 TaxID=3027796 RepID=UPI003DA8978A
MLLLAAALPGCQHAAPKVLDVVPARGEPLIYPIVPKRVPAFAGRPDRSSVSIVLPVDWSSLNMDRCPTGQTIAPKDQKASEDQEAPGDLTIELNRVTWVRIGDGDRPLAVRVDWTAPPEPTEAVRFVADGFKDNLEACIPDERLRAEAAAAVVAALPRSPSADLKMRFGLTGGPVLGGSARGQVDLAPGMEMLIAGATIGRSASELVYVAAAPQSFHVSSLPGEEPYLSFQPVLDTLGVAVSRSTDVAAAKSQGVELTHLVDLLGDQPCRRHGRLFYPTSIPDRTPVPDPAPPPSAVSQAVLVFAGSRTTLDDASNRSRDSLTQICQAPAVGNSCTAFRECIYLPPRAVPLVRIPIRVQGRSEMAAAGERLGHLLERAGVLHGSAVEDLSRVTLTRRTPFGETRLAPDTVDLTPEAARARALAILALPLAIGDDVAW